MKTSLAGMPRLDRDDPLPLHQQVASYIRGLIIGGSLPPGTALLSSRKISLELGCSRTVVLEAFELLYAEGYLHSTPRGYVRVASGFPKDSPRRRNQFREDSEDRIRISNRWQTLIKDRYEIDPESVFSTVAPNIDDFPFDHWARLARRVWSKPSPNLFTEDSSAGYYVLRVQIAEFLRNVRGMICQPDEVVVTSGSSSALDICSRMLLNPGDEVWVEEPGFVEARWTHWAAGAKLIPVPVDGEGLNVEEGIRRSPNARLAIVTPSHQFPLGVVMSPQRRLALLQWAYENNAWLIEDDYTSEFRRHGSVFASLKSMDRNNRVIYVGTFTKLLFPSLRLGYLVTSSKVASIFAKGRTRLGLNTPITAQPVLAEFIRDGSLLRHLRKMRKMNMARYDAVSTAIRRHLADELDLIETTGGLHIASYLKNPLCHKFSDRYIASKSKYISSFVQPLSQSYMGINRKNGFIFGYTKIPIKMAEVHIKKIRNIILELD